MRIRIGRGQKLEWSDIQERIDWLVESHISFERSTQDGPSIANRHSKGYVVDFYFDTMSDAVRFKLAWGGK